MLGIVFKCSWKNDKLYKVNIILCSFNLKKYGFEHFDSIALGTYFFKFDTRFGEVGFFYGQGC